MPVVACTSTHAVVLPGGRPLAPGDRATVATLDDPDLAVMLATGALTVTADATPRTKRSSTDGTV